MKLGGPKGDARNRSRRTPLVVLIMGILLVALGIAYQAATTGTSSGRQPTVLDQIVFGVFVAVGGGVIGASLNTLIVRRFEWDALSEVREIVSQSLGARFLSEDRELRRYREVWHEYHSTQVEGSACWWYERIPLGQDLAVGSLSVESTLLDSTGDADSYLNEIGVRGNRLILIRTREDGSESAGVAVFPAPRGFEDLHTGILVHESWDSTQMLSMTIMSKRPLIRNLPEGRVDDDQHVEMLDRVWRERFHRRVNVVLKAPT